MNPLPERTGNVTEPEYDVLLEFWYPGESTFQACGKKSRHDIAKEIAEDEARLFEKGGADQFGQAEHRVRGS